MVSTITDYSILKLIRNHDIVERAGFVYKWHRKHYKFNKLKPYFEKDRWHYTLALRDPNNTRRNIKRSVSAGKLVWMVAHRQEVPAGHDVDHIDRDANNNHPDNLRLLTIRENRSQNDQHSSFEECFLFFEGLAWLGS